MFERPRHIIFLVLLMLATAIEKSSASRLLPTGDPAEAAAAADSASVRRSVVRASDMDPEHRMPGTVVAAAQPNGAGQSRALNITTLRALKRPVGLPAADPPTFWSRDFFTGDWGGLRSALWDGGVEIAYAQYNDVFINVGGMRDGTAHFGVGVASLDFQTGPMGLWEGGTVHITTALTWGESIAREDAGSLSSAYYYDNARVDGFKLFECWYEQRFDENRLGVRIGQIYSYVSFGNLPGAGPLLNSSFHYPAFLGSALTQAGGAGLTTAFVAALPSILVRYQPGSSWTFTGMVQDGYADPSGGFGTGNTHGVTPTLSMREGAEFLFQATLQHGSVAPGAGRSGIIAAGMQLHTGSFALKNRNTTGGVLGLEGGEPASSAGNVLGFVMLEQRLINGDLGIISAFAKAMLAPADRNIVSSNLCIGLALSQFLSSRPMDRIALGYSRTQVSPDLGAFLSQTGRPATGEESVVELAYLFQPSPWMMLRPSLQYIHDPGAVSSARDAVLLGVTSCLSL